MMGLIFLAILFIVIVLLGAKLYVKLTTGWCYSSVCLVGKTVIVTGANSGIGYEAAVDFAKRGAKVILACRNMERGLDAKAKIVEDTDNQNVVFKQLDVSSLKSVRDFANDINTTESRLDVLLNNAGGLFESKKTEDDLLLMMATNYLGPFLLTNLLLDLLKKTPNSRVVNVASLGAKICVKNLDVNQLTAYPEGESNIEHYSRSKLCIVLFTIELAKRLKGTSVTAYSLHPGLALTDIFYKLPLPAIAKVPITQIVNWFFKDSMEGAQTSIYCSVAKGIESFSGENFADCAYETRYKTAQDPELPKKLWKVSEELVNLKSK